MTERIPTIDIDKKYLRIAKDPVALPIALELAVDAHVPAWKHGNLDVGEMRKNLRSRHSTIVNGYEEARVQCDLGDPKACEDENRHIQHIGLILQIADGSSEGLISEHVERIKPAVKPAAKILPYIES